MAKTPTPRNGCFTASHPGTTWVEVPCGKAPERPITPAHRGAGAGSAETVGNGANDWVAQESTGVISAAEGAFPLVTGVTSQNESFTLQLNSNAYSAGPFCQQYLQNPRPTCQEWQQFVYLPGSLFMQYWIIDSQTACPAGWWSYGNDCYTNSTQSVPVPAFPLADLGEVTMAATVGSTDTVVLSVGSTLYTLAVPSMLTLNTWWTAAEFNVFGPGNGSQVNFDANSTLLVRTSVESPIATSVPSCVDTSFTGETNNLSQVPSSCCVLDGARPAVQFTESNVAGATAPGCPASNCTPTACSTNMCGTQSDGCGGQISCGGCGAHQTCEGGYCVVTSCSSPPPTCGPLTHYVGAPTCGCVPKVINGCPCGGVSPHCKICY